APQPTQIWMCRWCQVSVDVWSRRRGSEKGEVNPPLRMLNGVQKFFAVLWLGRTAANPNLDVQMVPSIG
ncbi:hypothetical protein VS883_28040, partial [Escherichia coli]